MPWSICYYKIITALCQITVGRQCTNTCNVPNYLIYSQKFSIRGNFDHFNWQLRCQNLIQQKLTLLKTIMCVHTQYTMAAVKCNLFHFTISRSSSPESRCHYYRFSRSCCVDSFQAQLVNQWGKLVFSSLAPLAVVFKIIIAKTLRPYINLGLIEKFSCQAIRYAYYYYGSKYLPLSQLLLRGKIFEQL